MDNMDKLCIIKRQFFFFSHFDLFKNMGWAFKQVSIPSILQSQDKDSSGKRFASKAFKYTTHWFRLVYCWDC